MSKNQTMSDQLAALRKKAIHDEPHKLAPAPRPKKANAPKLGAVAAVESAERERTAVNLTPGALGALKRIQAFLITDGGATSASASAAMCAALEYVGRELDDHKGEIVALFQASTRLDRRRKIES